MTGKARNKLYAQRALYVNRNPLSAAQARISLVNGRVGINGEKKWEEMKALWWEICRLKNTLHVHLHT